MILLCPIAVLSIGKQCAKSALSQWRTFADLDAIGAPTLVFNVAAGQGASEPPLLPSHGVLSHPRANKHMVFRGDLLHGVTTVRRECPNNAQCTPCSGFLHSGFKHLNNCTTLLST